MSRVNLQGISFIGCENLIKVNLYQTVFSVFIRIRPFFYHSPFELHHYLFFSFQKGESNIGLIHSSEKNCGKSLTFYLLSKLQGLASRHHPLLLSGGNQSTSGTSAYVSSIFSHIIFTAGKRIWWEKWKKKKIPQIKFIGFSLETNVL